jgi:hypothetical protein
MLRHFALGLVLLLIWWRAPGLFVGPLILVGLAGVAWTVRTVVRTRRAVSDFGADTAQAVLTLRSSRRWQTTAANVGLTKGGQRPRGLMGRAEPVTFVPRVLRVGATPYGAVAVIVGVPGQDLNTWSAACGRLSSALGVAAVTVTEPVPNQFVLALRARDPLAQPILAPALVRPSDISFVLGMTESGEWEHMSPGDHSGLVVCGAPGSGKTAWLTQSVGGLLTHRDAQLLLIDGKAGHDLDPLAPRAYAYLSGDRSDPLSVLMALRDVQSVMRRRLANAPSWFRGAPNYWALGPHEGHPVILVVIDEAQTYLDQRSGISRDEKNLIGEIHSVVMDLVKKGRSAGIVLVLATQKGTVDAIPSAIRDQCGLRVCFRVATREAAEAALGQVPADAPTPIGLDRGVGIAVSPELGVIRFRSPFVGSDAVARDLAHLAGLTRDPTCGPESAEMIRTQGITEGDPA